MISLKIEDGDLVIDGQGNFVTIEGKEEEVQCVERVLTTNKDEWFLNILHGLAYSTIFSKPFDEAKAKLAITEAIHQDTRVESVEDVEFRFDRPNRHLDLYIKVKMNSGNVIEEVFPLG